MAMVTVHVFNGSPARKAPAGKALDTLADMLGYDAKTLYANKGGWVFRWCYRDAGTPVGRIAAA